MNVDKNAVVTIDVNDLTYEELEELEELLDLPFDEFFVGHRRAKVMRGLTFIAMRRRDATFTWEDAAKIRIGEVQSPAADPTEASG